MLIRVGILAAFYILLSIAGYGQQIKINERFENESLSSVLAQIESKHDVRFFYDQDWIEDISVNTLVLNQDLDALLRDILGQSGLTFKYLPVGKYIIYRNQSIVERFRVGKLYSDAQVRVIGDSSNLVLGEPVTVAGKVRSAQNGEGLTGVAVQVKDENLGDITGADGGFAFSLVPGFYELQFNFIGMQPETIPVKVFSSGRLDLDMYDKTIRLEEITVSSESLQEKLTGINIGRNTVTAEMLAAAPPSFLGERDIVKSFLSLPGVSQSGDGAAGINVRGESAGQNLVLIDDMPIFNPSHLFGFFTGFNSEIVNQASLYKGHVPAEFGGRTSAILDISTLEPSSNQLKINGFVGTSNGNLFAEMPLIKDKTHLYVSGRASYINWIMNLWPVEDVRQSSAQYYDTNFKLTHKTGENGKLSVYGYLSDDAFSFPDDTTYAWQNRAIGAKYSVLLKNRHLIEVNAYHSDYTYEISNAERFEAFEGFYSLSQDGVQANIILDYEKFDIQAGTGAKYNQLEPGNFTPEEGVEFRPIDVQDETSVLAFAYGSIDFRPIKKLNLSVGARYNNFFRLGPHDELIYQEGTGRSNLNIIDTISYSTGDTFSNYNKLEPRVSANYTIDENNSIKFGYGINNQFLHLVSNTNTITPFDIWKQSSRYLSPQTSTQYSLGYFRNLKKAKLEFSAEAFYKELDNVIDFKDGSELLFNENVESELIQGRGLTYGTEFLLRKNSGRLSGWISYTFSRSYRKIDNELASERVNEGNWFPSNFDTPHIISVTTSYKLSRKWKFGGQWNYSTGRPITVPGSTYRFDRFSFGTYENRNNFRLPDYHRLDISFTYENQLRKNTDWNTSWTFSIFNLYGRDNAYSIFTTSNRTFFQQANQVTLLGAMFPSLTFRFKYKN